MLRLGLHQLVDFPTHLHSDGNLGSLLDVLLVSCDRIVSEITSLPPLTVGLFDHIPLIFFFFFFFFLLKSRLQSHFVAVNCGFAT